MLNLGHPISPLAITLAALLAVTIAVTQSAHALASSHSQLESGAAVAAATSAAKATSIQTPAHEVPTRDRRTASQRGLAWYQSNTGVPPGTTLRRSGPLNITTDGTIIDGLEVTGDITFSAADITIRNTLVHGRIVNERPGRGPGGQYDNGYRGQNILIEHVEVDAPANTRAIVSAWSTTMRFVKVHGGVQGTSFAGYNRITDSYFYGLRSTSGGHAENVISNGNPNRESGHTIIARNWLDATDARARTSGATWVSGALCLYSDFGKINNVVIKGNFLTGAGYLLGPGVARGSTGNNLTVRNNVFQPSGPYSWAPVYPSPLDALSEAKWANNFLADGTLVPPPR